MRKLKLNKKQNDMVEQSDESIEVQPDIVKETFLTADRELAYDELSMEEEDSLQTLDQALDHYYDALNGLVAAAMDLEGQFASGNFMVRPYHDDKTAVDFPFSCSLDEISGLTHTVDADVLDWISATRATIQRILAQGVQFPDSLNESQRFKHNGKVLDERDFWNEFDEVVKANFADQNLSDDELLAEINALASEVEYDNDVVIQGHRFEIVTESFYNDDDEVGQMEDFAYGDRQKKAREGIAKQVATAISLINPTFGRPRIVDESDDDHYITYLVSTEAEDIDDIDLQDFIPQLGIEVGQSSTDKLLASSTWIDGNEHTNVAVDVTVDDDGRHIYILVTATL